MKDGPRSRPGSYFRSEPPKVGLEQGLALEQVGQDTYRNVQAPWTWPNSPVVPGGTLAGLAAAAAYKTVAQGFAIDMLSVQFIAGPTAKTKMHFKVDRLNDGGRFASRLVTTTQNGKIITHVTCSFVRASAMGGPSISHTPQRATSDAISKITFDDLDENRHDEGPWMRFQRLSLENDRMGYRPERSLPEHLVHTFVATISPPIKAPESEIHVLGIIALSDYHVVDCPPITHHLGFGQPLLGDETRTPTNNDFDRFTSLNHTVHFHAHEGFRADEFTYIEARCPWSGRRRGLIETRIFSKDGTLIATCTQEGYYVLKEGILKEKL
ncbi:Putative acyl-CoA thioesterase, HotDog domain superfamily [Septoria linicola]|uniref:Acyl-CoA thioesterase, HotDog domain superfamily n=1 Tax=Septoria linicola TaxID=215465 RepID=A0A9Q9EG37_9PEZI|nr:putative acyl-CoA thioesterase, HotDog domain superfamily [Septoria linicola]USW48317.1 Putative acyl-CoA thioesterase, HotDog domain superfamily [Septoria linicola]